MDRVADAEVVRRLVGDMLCLHHRRLRQFHLQPAMQLGHIGNWHCLHALPHLCHKHQTHTATLQPRTQGHHGMQWVGGQVVAHKIGNFASGLLSGYPLGQPAQILD